MATAPDTQQVSSSNKSKKIRRRQSGMSCDPAMANNAGVGGAVGGAATQAPPTRQLEFNQAMADFKTMFPSMDSDVIETVLRANNGAVDATIDQLLTLAADMPETPQRPQHPQLPHYSDTVNHDFISSPVMSASPSAPASQGNTQMGDKPPPYSPPSPNSPFSQEIRSRQLPPTPNQQTPLIPHHPTPSPMVTPSPSLHDTSRMAPSRPRHPRWNPPLVGELPADFLRVGRPGVTRRLSNQQMLVSAKLQERMAQNEQQQNSVDVNDVEMQRILEDERFALTLQNEEFMRELQRSPEFLEALNNDYLNAIGSASTTTPPAPINTLAPIASHTPGAYPSNYGQSQGRVSQDTAGVSPQAGGGVVAATGGASNDDVEFRNKLSHMGKTTKYKFAQIAKRFNYRKRRSSSKPQLEDAPAASTMNLLDDYDESGDSALLGTRPEVEENLYTEPSRV